MGLCQVYTEEWAVEDNVNRTIAAIEEAARQGAQIAITPECVFHGYGDAATEDFLNRLYAAAEPLNGPHLQKICQKAAELELYILVGFAERGEDLAVHNSAALISNTGEILNVYRKVHCRPFEDIHYQGGFTPGADFSVHPIQVGESEFKAGTIICFDREIPESIRCLRGLGAEIIFCPLATDTSDARSSGIAADNELITRCRAAENEVFIVVVNHAGRFNGGSFVVGPSGELLHQMGSSAGVQVLDVPVGKVEKYHENPLGWMGWGYRRQEIYSKYLK